VCEKKRTSEIFLSIIPHHHHHHHHHNQTHRLNKTVNQPQISHQSPNPSSKNSQSDVSAPRARPFRDLTQRFIAASPHSAAIDQRAIQLALALIDQPTFFVLRRS
jgi:hypothetical protein